MSNNIDYDKFANWYTHTAPDESEVAVIDMAYMAWQAANAEAEDLTRKVEELEILLAVSACPQC